MWAIVLTFPWHLTVNYVKAPCHQILRKCYSVHVKLYFADRYSVYSILVRWCKSPILVSVSTLASERKIVRTTNRIKNTQRHSKVGARKTVFGQNDFMMGSSKQQQVLSSTMSASCQKTFLKDFWLDRSFTRPSSGLHLHLSWPTPDLNEEFEIRKSGDGG